MTISETQPETTVIGVYPNIPASVYHAWPHCSNSRLTILKDSSPLHVRYAMEHPTEPTPAMVLGTAAHAAILEPETFDNLYCVAGPCVTLLKSGERKGEPCEASGKHYIGGHWFCGKHGSDFGDSGRIIISLDDSQSVNGMCAAVLAHPSASTLLDAANEREASLVWSDRATELVCKARIDALARKSGLIVDLKTTEDASPEKFERTIYDRGYHRQAAHYINGCAACGITITDYVIIAVEKSAPFAVAVYRITDEAIEAGNVELRKLIERYHHCQLMNEWPGYPMTDIGIPSWKMKQIESAV